MKKVKITVLKTTLDEELAAEYGAEGLGPCPMLREGQVFYADYAKPDGLCDEAWKAIYQYVFALAHGAGEGLFYYGDWIRRPGVAICSCNDGLRPVIFKLETTEEEASVNYTPVRKNYLLSEYRKQIPFTEKGGCHAAAQGPLHSSELPQRPPPGPVCGLGGSVRVPGCGRAVPAGDAGGG